jgi:hypothetical protein
MFFMLPNKKFQFSGAFDTVLSEIVFCKAKILTPHVFFPKKRKPRIGVAQNYLQTR